MTVSGCKAIAVINLHHLAVSAAPSSVGDDATRGRANRVAGGSAEIQASMHGGPSEKRIDAHAEIGRGVDLAGHRPAQRHRRKRPIEPIHLSPGDTDAIELAF